MKRKIVVLLFALLTPWRASAEEALLIITSVESEVDHCDLTVLRRVVSGKQFRWRASGKRIRFINLNEGSQARSTLYKKLFGVSADHRFFIGNSRKVFRSIEMRTQKEVIDIVSSVPESLGYVLKSSVNMSEKKRIKVLLEIGL